LYSLDYASSYQHAFVYVRQLALHLRTAMQKKTPEAVRVVYCWQYLHCLKLWTAVLASSCRSRGAAVATTGGTAASTTTISTNTTASDGDAALLRSLIYPLVEIIFGVARLIPTARHLPLRLHCVRYLQQLAAFSESYIPTTSILLEAFDLKEITMAPKREMKNKKKKGDAGGGGGGGDIRGVRLPVVFKLPKVDALRNVEQLDACLGELFTLLGREVELYRYSAGLPEFTIRICQRLRKFSKETRNGKYRAYARGCIELCEKYSKFAITARSALEEAPSDIKTLEILLPKNTSNNQSAPNMGARYDAAIGREKPFEAMAQPALSKSAKAKAAKGGGMAEEVLVVKDAKGRDANGKEMEKNKRKKRAKKVVLNQADLKNTAALDEKDEVSEGINWSESEADDDDDGDDNDDSDDASSVGSD